MRHATDAMTLLRQEARALLSRVERVGTFVLQETMLPAAAVSPEALFAIERHIDGERARLARLVEAFIAALSGSVVAPAAHDAQRQFSLLRIRFNAVLTQVDLFADALTQRSEHENGVWLKGLDVFAMDALRLPRARYAVPPLMCYLDRGAGAAIRRARTRLPGGGTNPLAIIRIPRERMVGSGVASSLAHEVGHQAAALLGLVEALRPGIRARQRDAQSRVWHLWERWLSETIADLWAVGRVGISATLGLLGVVSLPSAFVTRISTDDPHPAPWIRVRASAAMGQALFPDRSWPALAGAWHALYPLDDTPSDVRAMLIALDRSLPALAELLVDTPIPSLAARTLRHVFTDTGSAPSAARALFAQWRRQPKAPARSTPCRAFAALGQARLDGALAPEEESHLSAELLSRWATQAALDSTFRCARDGAPVPAPIT